MGTRVESFILPLLLCQVGAWGGPPAPLDLLVNGAGDPLAVDRDAVQFTWALPGTQRGAAQTAFQVLVASSRAALDSEQGDFWDSGRMTSGKNASVPYLGKPLAPGLRCWWKVRYWNESGQCSAYSHPARFDTGLARGEWTARYIWDGTTNLNNFAYFRKAFSVGRKPTLAKVYVTAHNDYLLYFNGQLLGRGPARCDPYYRGQYNAYDITRMVRAGSNVFAAAGHWHGTYNNCAINGQPAFLLEARLDFPDGASQILGTDESWRVLAQTGYTETNATYFRGVGPKKNLPGPAGGEMVDLDHPQWASSIVAIRNDANTSFIYRGVAGGSSNRAAIQFDGRLEPADWKAIGFDDSGWAQASGVDRSDYRLFAQMAPAENEQAELKPVSVRREGEAWLVDFGRCIDGWPQLKLRANRPGDRVRITYYQLAGERGQSGWDEYTCRGGVELWKPDFGRHTSFQVLQITGYAGKLNAGDARAIWAYCDADVAGRFRCSSKLLNAIYEMSERSARQNVQQAIISVDADREQSPWTADSWNIGNVLLYNHRHTTMIDKIVRDYAVEQLPNGNFPACCPAQRSRSIPEWSMYWPMLLWEQYLFSGDDALLREMSPRLQAFLAWLKKFQNPATKLLDPPGWRISDYAGGNMPNGGYNIATACQYYENLRIASRIFSVLGETSRSEDCLRQAEEVKTGINAHLFNGEYYLARTDRKEMFPLASTWPLRFDLVPPEAKPRVLASLRQHGSPVLGGYGGDAFYSGLLNAGGMGDFVIRDLERYQTMLKGNGANWESFGKGGEYNHAWTAYPGYLFQKYISGIQPTGGGFSTFDVRPEVGGLEFAESVVPAVKGLLKTRWEKLPGNRLSISLNVPTGSEATLFIPGSSGEIATVEESGVVLWPASPSTHVPGVASAAEENGSVRFRLRAGAYRFMVKGNVRTKGSRP